jgi:hypothetical protein
MPTDQRDSASAEPRVPGAPWSTELDVACSTTIAYWMPRARRSYHDSRAVRQSLFYNIRTMKKALVLGLIAAACLAGCKKSSTSGSAPKADDAVQLKLKQLAGPGAADCGRLDVRAADQQLTGASSCATKAAESKHPFYVAYDMPGMVTGVAGSSDGKLFAVQLQGSGTGGQLASGPCPAELRVAHSGRVTCFIPGTMGLTPTASDPHSGIAISPGANPQGGMGIPQPFPAPPKSGTSKPAPKSQ